ncbi:MAG: hypothetical protein KGL92_11940 [Gammaproteobacteria bacterium]|nr:hypothetical protein [Gammaproteobacteria bacterium]
MRRRDQLTPADGGAPATFGRFLEFSTPAPDIEASIGFYRKLGFATAEVGEAWRHPYAVAGDGRLYIGLHQSADFGPALTFVKPDLLKHLALLERAGVDFEFRHLGADVFNEIGWRDPSATQVRFIEARTFSPLEWPPARSSLLGYFREIALPAADFAASKAHWEGIGFVGVDEPDAPEPHIGCTSDTVDVGLYEPQRVGRPSLVFEVTDPAAAVERIAAAGLEPAARAGAPFGAFCFSAPEGTPIILVGAA